jgi:glutaminyl-peptide cyclotransferase
LPARQSCLYITCMFTSLLLLLGTLVQASPIQKPKALLPIEIKFDSTHAYQFLKDQCALGPRNTGSEGHHRAIEYFTEYFKAQGIPLIAQKFVHADMATGEKVNLTNLIGTVKGKDPKRKPVIFCAHWDTRPRADQESNPAFHDRPILGANDGASGVAVLMELARLLKHQIPLQTIYIVLFDGEDYGREGNIEEYFLGARYFAENLPVKEVEYALLLDMIGDKDLSLPMEQNSLSQSPALVQRIWQLAQTLGLDAFQMRPGPTVLDDHMPLQAKGIPAIDIIDFHYPAWHTLGDTPDKCSAYSLGMTGRLVASLALKGLP